MVNTEAGMLRTLWLHDALWWWILHPSRTGKGCRWGFKMTALLSSFPGSGSAVRTTRSTRGSSARITTPVKCTPSATATLLLTSTTLAGGGLSKGWPVPTLGPGAQGILPKNAMALKRIQLLVSLYVILPAASFPCSHGFLHCVN